VSECGCGCECGLPRPQYNTPRVVLTCYAVHKTVTQLTHPLCIGSDYSASAVELAQSVSDYFARVVGTGAGAGAGGDTSLPQLPYAAPVFLHDDATWSKLPSRGMSGLIL
jgi:hypothetical protein